METQLKLIADLEELLALMECFRPLMSNVVMGVWQRISTDTADARELLENAGTVQSSESRPFWLIAISNGYIRHSMVVINKHPADWLAQYKQDSNMSIVFALPITEEHFNKLLKADY